MEVWTINDCRAGAIMCRGQRTFNITHQTNLPHSSLECYEVVGLIDTSQCSVNQTAQVVSQPISDFLPTINNFNNDPLPKTINNRLLWWGCSGIWYGKEFYINTQGQCRGTTFTPCFIKTNPYLISHNFGKCWPIITFFHPRTQQRSCKWTDH